MNCQRIDERLLSSMTEAGPAPAFDDAEGDHLRNCNRCRDLVEAAAAVRAADAETASRPATADEPDPRYWGTIVPRLRAKIDARRPGPFGIRVGALGEALLPAAAAVVAIVAIFSILRSPAPSVSDASETLASLGTLSEAELHDLGVSGSTTALLDPAESASTGSWTLADLISEIVSEQGDTVLYAVSEPEELVPHLDDERFAEVVALLEQR